MEKINIDDIKYQDFIKEDNIYGVVFIYDEMIGGLFNKIDNGFDYLKLKLSDPTEMDYIDYEVIQADSVQEIQDYVDKLSNDSDKLLHAEGYYQKQNFDDEEDFEYTKKNYRYISDFFNTDNDLDYCYPKINYDKYVPIVYSKFFETETVELLGDVNWLLDNIDSNDKIWKDFFKETKEKYRDLMLKLQNIFLNGYWINMHRKCLQYDCFGYKDLLVKCDKLLSSYSKVQ